MNRFEELILQIVAFRDDRSWCRFHTPKDLALALTIEAGELAENFLWKTEMEASDIASDTAKRTAVADEIADVLIYALLLAHHYNIDPAAAIESKLEKNAIKYPVERSRGNAKKYTEFEK